MHSKGHLDQTGVEGQKRLPQEIRHHPSYKESAVEKSRWAFQAEGSE